MASDDEPTKEELWNRIRRLEEHMDWPDRRSVLKAGAVGATGAAMGFGGGRATAQSNNQAGTVGTQSSPVDVYGEDLYDPNGNTRAVADIVSSSGGGGVGSLGYVDASSSSGADLNSALANNSSGAVVHGGTLVTTETINLPSDKTLFLYNSTIQADGSVGIGEGGMTTRLNTSGDDYDKLIDAAGNSNCGVVCLGYGRLDGNISDQRIHIDFINSSSNNFVEGPLELRGGVGIQVIDCTQSNLENIFWNASNDSNNLVGNIMTVENTHYSEVSNIFAIGNSSATNNIADVVDFNGAGSNNTVSNVYGDDINSTVVDLANEWGTTVSNVGLVHRGATDTHAVSLQVKQRNEQTHSTASGSSSNGITISNATKQAVNGGDTYPAFQVVKNGDGGTAHGVTATNVTGVNCPGIHLYPLNQPSDTDTMNSWQVQATSYNSGTFGHEIRPPQQHGWDLDLSTDRSSGSNGIQIHGLQLSTGTLRCYSNSGDGVLLNDNNDYSNYQVASYDNTGDGVVLGGASSKVALFVNSCLNGGYGVNALNSPDTVKLDGVVTQNTSGQTNGLGSGSVTDLAG